VFDLDRDKAKQKQKQSSQEAQLANPMVSPKFFVNVNSIGNMSQSHHHFKSCFYPCFRL